MEQPEFRAGQVWSYKTRPEDKASTLSIWKVDFKDYKGGTAEIVHISVLDVTQPNGVIARLSHVPIDAETLVQCVTGLLQEHGEVADASEGYSVWREVFDDGEAGWFTVPVSEIVEINMSLLKEKGLV